MKVMLFVVFILAGQQPQQKTFPVPDLETCWEQARLFLDDPPAQIIETGGVLQASCVLVFEKQTGT